jgi:hypothetical protein
LDGVADHINPNSIPVEVLDYVAERCGTEANDLAALAILIDYHFLYVLSLLSLRVWDDGDPSANLQQLGQLLTILQGPHGSRHRFADDAATLLLFATSHFEQDERGYDGLLVRVRDLDGAQQLAIAFGHAAALGSHLRFGFEATYGRDIAAARDDNRADYPWLAFSLAALFREAGRLRAAEESIPGRARVLEAIANGLSADARAFLGSQPVAALREPAAVRADWDAVRDEVQTWGPALREALEPHRPSATTYSPVSLFFNFSQNVIKGTAIDALLWGEKRTVTLNDLLTATASAATAGEPPSPTNADKEQLARTLMAYARANPHRIRGRATPVIVYDPQGGRRAFGAMLRDLGGAA